MVNGRNKSENDNSRQAKWKWKGELENKQMGYGSEYELGRKRFEESKTQNTLYLVLANN